MEMVNKMDDTTQSIIKYFNVKYFDLLNEYQVHCCYHDDGKKSASLNFKKKVFYCFTCNLGKSFEQIYKEKINNGNLPGLSNSNIINTDIINLHIPNNIGDTKQTQVDFKHTLANLLAQQTQTQRILVNITPEQAAGFAINAMKDKGIPFEVLDIVKAEPIINPNEMYFGYIKFPTGENTFVARKYLPDDLLEGERYLLSAGARPLVGEITNEHEDYILVEGILDYISMKYILGHTNTICNLSTAINPERAYKFKNKVVFILFDNDYAGFESAQKAFRSLRQVNAYPIILDIPEKFGKDPNEAIHNHQEDFKEWLSYHTKQAGITDTEYINDFGNETTLYTLKSGIHIIDDELFSGGYSVGLHAIAAKPSVGKTALGLFIAHNLVIYNNYQPRCLYISYEIPKKQCWARLASIYDHEREWREIEKTSVMSLEAKRMMNKLAQNIRIVSGWDISEIARVAGNYDAIFIDYIQKMPGNHIDEKVNVSRNIKALSTLMVEKEKIIFIISSIPRASYDKEDLSVFKESGDVEFAIQSGMLLMDINKGGEQRLVKVTVLKNTRGPVGNSFWMEGNMLHNTFKEIIPDL